MRRRRIGWGVMSMTHADAGPDRRATVRSAQGLPRSARRTARTIPDYFNNPVPSFVGDNVRLLIVGLAPGLQGANRTGRPFTGDWAGDLLYATLLKHGLGARRISRAGR